MRYQTIREIKRIIDASKQFHPQTDLFTRKNGVVQEFGEALQALAKWELLPNTDTKAHLRSELLQAAGCIVRLLEEVLEVEGLVKPEDVCVWRCDAEGTWISSCCVEPFGFDEGGPLENLFQRCPYCGRGLVEMGEKP